MKTLPPAIKIALSAVAGLVAAKLFGILNASLDAANGQPHEAGWSIGLGLPFFWLSMYLLGGFSQIRTMGTADAGAKQAALSLKPPSGRAVVIVYREGWIGQTNPIDVTVDGDPLGQLSFSHFTAMELAPGEHRVMAGIARNGRWIGQPQQTDFRIAAGQTLAFRVALGFRGVTLAPVDDMEAAVRKLTGRTMVSTPCTGAAAI